MRFDVVAGILLHCSRIRGRDSELPLDCAEVEEGALRGLCAVEEGENPKRPVHG